MAIANHASSAALPKAAYRTRTPAISATPSVASRHVAAHATSGIAGSGTNGFSSAVRRMNRSKVDQFGAPVHSPNRPATAERNAAPIATRA